MTDDLSDPVSLTREIRRLREAVRRILTLETSDPELPEKLENLKKLVGGALDRVDVIRQDTGPRLKKVRELAKIRRKETTAARYKLIMDEILAIEAKAGKQLKPYSLALRMNERGNIHPLIGIEWNEASIRLVLKAAGR